jgi:hypothetical protein
VPHTFVEHVRQNRCHDANCRKGQGVISRSGCSFRLETKGIFEPSAITLSSHSTYQSECADHRAHERHRVSVHWRKRAGHISPVSHVFHESQSVREETSCRSGSECVGRKFDALLLIGFAFQNCGRSGGYTQEVRHPSH